ncbi:YGGT family protein [Nitzschia inconspicua]|uniref:YGGT family protein n=1 Tax=Nitzschia inconspicua TaxID=303405 RepID=A0A9K3KZ27_9STRA|nr:YGGT family protein [Nitzschia inconspicua]
MRPQQRKALMGLLLPCIFVVNHVAAFAPSPVPYAFIQSSHRRFDCPTPRTVVKMMDAGTMQESIHALVPVLQPPSMLLAETEAWLCRVVASWYPETNLNEFPWAIVAWPSEPLLRLVKGAIPPAFGVDITPVFWLAIFTFINEILLGQQGLLVMKMKYGI